MDHQQWEAYYQTLRELRSRAEAALQGGDPVTARRLAQELLTQNTDSTVWDYGNEVHAANQIMGLAALQEGDTEAAKGYLLAAGETPGSPQLDSFGPTMTLAQALLGRGESAVVLEYLDRVAQFWATPKPVGNIADVLGRRLASRNTRTLNRWKAAIRAGEAPTLNRVARAA